ncbi:Ankyrin repeat and KAP P-loop domain and Ankyrin repeat-containing domain-containing protein [Strongyloides ratti]|uniref:Ankyrin repeat and KAP P-loop domain and Ankyrin repeat-containing domain-containing protein n=1 Tax=Strongyloides ratti TaxID=34506 RepID=A0A090LNP2_STRRB|nr:Ankyrin repeat and KAP P-loop domain and Ankyrin repeat-containing domain-containing protein [Strongyloides ratti]CEF71376.1 Ankyrin repeat and KAP P-loop domain and Ankyrin repeat-containing domain-containing protein [Strongyloides ratti]
MLQEASEENLDIEMALRANNSNLTITSLSQMTNELTDIALGDIIAQKMEQFFLAIENGESFPVEKLREHHVKNYTNKKKETFLIAAARYGNLETCEIVIDGSDVHAKDEDGFTALLNACQNGYPKIVKLLLEKGAYVDGTDMYGWTPLFWAVYNNHIECIQELLVYSPRVNLVEPDDNLTPLIIASARGYTECVKILLDNGANPNSSDKFGSTPLIWASRKGYYKIVEFLVNSGATVDNIGMHGRTALMLAVKGNYIKTVDILLSREPKINIVDLDGVPALEIAAREGYIEICKSLLDSGAYVNSVDRFGSNVLIAAVRGGSLDIVKMLLERHADVNQKDSDYRTPLHLAVDKNFVDMIVLILTKNPNLEAKTKDGDTPLMRAAKNKNIRIMNLLLNAGSKVSTTDQYGNNCLHIAAKAKSLQMIKLILSNPSESRLLYSPNNFGETPYSIDQQNSNPILSQMYGVLDSEAQVNSLLGYEIYADVLADILSEPKLHLPVTVGFFAKWGTSKSLHLPKIKRSLRNFSRSWLDGVELTWSWTIITFLFLVCTFLTLPITTFSAIFQRSDITYGILSAGITIFILTVIAYLIMCFSNDGSRWSTSIKSSKGFTKFVMELKLILSITMLNVPYLSSKELIIAPVTFLFADDHRLSYVGTERTIATILLTLHNVIENHFGIIPTRILLGTKKKFGKSTDHKFRNYLGFPVIILSLVIWILFFLSNFFLTQCIINWSPDTTNSGIFLGAVLCTTLLLVIGTYPFILIVKNVLFNRRQRKIKKISFVSPKIGFEATMEKLKNEATYLCELIEALNCYSHSQVRLVIPIDGMDNQDHIHMVKLLDSMHSIFGSHIKANFIVILAVDPYAIDTPSLGNVKTFELSKGSTAHDYIKEYVTLPFFLQIHALRELQKNIDRRKDIISFNDEMVSKIETISEIDEYKKKNYINSPQSLHLSSLGTFLVDDEYFATLGPTALRRIVNSLTLTARLLHSYDVKFQWISLGFWISLVEQWPYRMCYLIEKFSISEDDSMTLYDLWIYVKDRLPRKQNLLLLDTTPSEFDSVLKKSTTAVDDRLTIEKANRYIPCTCNLDPYLRKIVSVEKDDVKMDEMAVNNSEAMLRYTSNTLLKDPSLWNRIDKPLYEMTIDDFIEYVEYLDIPEERLSKITNVLRNENINGIVVCTCDINNLKEKLNCTIGDWTLISLLIETIRRITSEQITRTNSAKAAATKVATESVEQAKKLIDQIPGSAEEERLLQKKFLKEHKQKSLEIVDEYGHNEFVIRKLSQNPIIAALNFHNKQDSIEMDDKESIKSLLGSEHSTRSNELDEKDPYSEVNRLLYKDK